MCVCVCMCSVYYKTVVQYYLLGSRPAVRRCLVVFFPRMMSIRARSETKTMIGWVKFFNFLFSVICFNLIKNVHSRYASTELFKIIYGLNKNANCFRSVYRFKFYYYCDSSVSKQFPHANNVKSHRHHFIFILSMININCTLF